MNADCGWPQWVFGMRSYAHVSKNQVALAACETGTWRLYLVDTRPEGPTDDAEKDKRKTRPSGPPALTPIPVPHTRVEFLVAASTFLAFQGQDPESPAGIVHVDLETGRVETLRRTSTTCRTPPPCLGPKPSKFRWTWARDVEGAVAYGFFYPPKAVPTGVPTAPGPRSWCWPTGGRPPRPAQPTNRPSNS